MGEELARTYLAALSPGSQALDATELGTTLSGLVDAARREHPDIELDAVGFVAHLARVCGTACAPDDLERLPIADLYLAYGCTLHDANALAVFHREFENDIDHVVSRHPLRGASADDMRARVLAKLLVDSPTARMKLAAYAGRGSLRSFVRIVTTRLMVDQLRAQGRSPRTAPVDTERLAAAARDPELALMHERFAPEVQAAFARAFKELPDRDRRLLRHALVSRLQLDAIGALFGVHRTTAARWVEAARQRLLQAVKADLTERLGVGGSTARSLIELVRSMLDLSVVRLLETDDDGTGPDSSGS